jgi:hypothetical protein
LCRLGQEAYSTARAVSLFFRIDALSPCFSCS